MKTTFRSKSKIALNVFLILGGVLALGLAPSARAVAQNHPPTVASIPTITANEGDDISYQVNASDAADSNYTLYYSLSGNSPWNASINDTGLFTWTPSEGQAPKTWQFFVNVSDGIATVQKQIKIKVNEVNTAPFISESFTGPYYLQENECWETCLSRCYGDFGDYDLDANCNPLQQLTVTASGVPSGATFSFDKANQKLFLSWTPSEAQGGHSYDVTFKVSDGKLSVTRTITFNVCKNNSAPILQTISDKQIKGGNTLTFTAKATDIDVPKNTLTYSLCDINGTSATINPTTGVFSWVTPTVGDPTTYFFTIKVRDNGHDLDSSQCNLCDEQNFLVSLTPGNPATVKGVTFTSQLVNEDSPNYTVLYTVTNNTPFYLRDLKISGILYGDWQYIQENWSVSINNNQVGSSGDDDDDEDNYDVTVTKGKTAFPTTNFVLTYVGDQQPQVTTTDVHTSQIDPSINGDGLAPGDTIQLCLETYISHGYFWIAGKTITPVAGPASLSFVCDPVAKPSDTKALNSKY